MTVDIKTSRVRDVMSRVVITVGPEDTMQDALGSMAQYRVTALPVTDARNRCVGILSLADLVDPTRFVDEGLNAAGRVSEHVRPWWLDTLQQGNVGERKVHEFMTGAVVVIDRETSLLQATEEMVRHRVHHLPVVDEHQRLLGIVSTLDLLEAFARSHAS
jgi:CBS-domain-containing membrane protein